MNSESAPKKDNNDVVVFQKNGVTATNQTVSHVSDMVSSLSNVASSIVDFQKTCVQAEKEIALMNLQIDELVLKLKDKSLDREATMKQVAALHFDINKFIDAAMIFMQKESLSDTEARLIERLLLLASEALSKLPNL